MKWKNLNFPGCCYFVTNTLRKYIPLFKDPEVIKIAIDSLNFLRNKYGFKILAYCLLPEHLHLIIYNDGALDISKIMSDFKRFSSKEIFKYLLNNNHEPQLQALRSAAYKGQNYAVWQETFRSELIDNQKHLQQKLDYIHDNPVRKGLVANAVEWRFSSARKWYLNEDSGLLVDEVKGIMFVSA
jgi:putative transposase